MRSAFLQNGKQCSVPRFGTVSTPEAAATLLSRASVKCEEREQNKQRKREDREGVYTQADVQHETGRSRHERGEERRGE